MGRHNQITHIALGSTKDEGPHAIFYRRPLGDYDPRTYAIGSNDSAERLRAIANNPEVRITDVMLHARGLWIYIDVTRLQRLVDDLSWARWHATVERGT